MSTDTAYNNTFFDALERGSTDAARVILPLVFDIVCVQSVIDIGCGRGAWLKVCEELGIADVVGVDGKYVDMATLLIHPSLFHGYDLSKYLDLSRQCDLALCLEVAEHLPQTSALSLIKTLTTLAPCVLFSAAIPGQGGTQHINEQWPEYWETLFGRYAFRKLDPIRRHVFQDARVPWWYQQNIYLYARQSFIDNAPLLQQEYSRTASQDTDVIATHLLKQFRNERECLAAERDSYREQLQVYRSTLNECRSLKGWLAAMARVLRA